MEAATDSALELLIAQDEDDLERLLGQARLETSGAPLTQRGAMGLAEDVQELGRELMNRWNRELYSVFCGDADGDKKDRESLLRSIGLGDVAIASAVASILVSSYALAPAVATILAALLVKRIVSPAGAGFCAYWKSRLPAE